MCKVCQSTHPRNTRTRASIYVETPRTRILVDTSPDLRMQALRHRLLPDALLFTHSHADHTHGIDDVRKFNFLHSAPLPTFTDRATMDSLHLRFPYVFRLAQPGPYQWYKASLTPFEIAPYAPFCIEDLTITPFTQKHGASTSLGFRFNRVAYSTDVNGLSEEAFAALEDLDVWIVDCLRDTLSPTHAHLEMALSWIERVRPKRAILTHLGHEMDYEALSNILPPSIEVGFDGMEVTVEGLLFS